MRIAEKIITEKDVIRIANQFIGRGPEVKNEFNDSIPVICLGRYITYKDKKEILCVDRFENTPHIEGAIVGFYNQTDDELLAVARKFIGKCDLVEKELLRMISPVNRDRFIRYLNSRGSFVIRIKEVYKVGGRVLGFYEPI